MNIVHTISQYQLMLPDLDKLLSTRHVRTTELVHFFGNYEGLSSMSINDLKFQQSKQIILLYLDS